MALQKCLGKGINSDVPIDNSDARLRTMIRCLSTPTPNLLMPVAFIHGFNATSFPKGKVIACSFCCMTPEVHLHWSTWRDKSLLALQWGKWGTCSMADC